MDTFISKDIKVDILRFAFHLYDLCLSVQFIHHNQIYLMLAFAIPLATHIGNATTLDKFRAEILFEHLTAEGFVITVDDGF